MNGIDHQLKKIGSETIVFHFGAVALIDSVSHEVLHMFDQPEIGGKRRVRAEHHSLDPKDERTEVGQTRIGQNPMNLGQRRSFEVLGKEFLHFVHVDIRLRIIILNACLGGKCTSTWCERERERERG